MVCRVAEVAGMGAFALKSPGQRLGAVAVTVVLGTLGRAGAWADGEDGAGYEGFCKSSLFHPCFPVDENVALLKCWGLAYSLHHFSSIGITQTIQVGGVFIFHD